MSTTPTPLLSEVHVALLRLLLPKEVETATAVNLGTGERCVCNVSVLANNVYPLDECLPIHEWATFQTFAWTENLWELFS